MKAELGIHSTDIRVGGMAYAWCPASHNARNLHNVRSAAAVLRSYAKNNSLWGEEFTSCSVCVYCGVLLFILNFSTSKWCAIAQVTVAVA